MRPDRVPLVILDDHSRYLTGTVGAGRHASRAGAGTSGRAVRGGGLPDAMLMDHGTPWWNMQSLCGLDLADGVADEARHPALSERYRHPQTQGKVERCNGSLEAAMPRRPRPTGQRWQSWLDAYREEHNHVRPHEALHMAVPAHRWRPSPRAFQEPTACEYSDPSNVRKVRENGGVSLRGQSYFVSRAFIGENVQLEFLKDIE